MRVYCFGGVEPRAVADFVRPLQGIEEVLERAEAAQRFDLPADVEGDVAVISTADYCIGMGRADHDLADLHGERLRTHGGLSERDVPFIVSRPLNAGYRARARSEQLLNHQIFDYAINGTA